MYSARTDALPIQTHVLHSLNSQQKPIYCEVCSQYFALTFHLGLDIVNKSQMKLRWKEYLLHGADNSVYKYISCLESYKGVPCLTTETG